MRSKKAHVFMEDFIVEHRVDHKITDPTSLVSVGDDWYLFTEEHDDFWNAKKIRMIVNRMYRVKIPRET